MPLMQEILAWRDAGKLNTAQSRWFLPAKPAEELYDLQADPDEVHNLADNPTYLNKLLELRKALTDWQQQIGDWGLTPEVEMVKQMYPNGKPPLTQAPIFEPKGKKVQITCATKGASIVYQLFDESQNIKPIWQLYTQPLVVQPNQTLKALATRIGYQESEPVSYVKTIK